MIRKLHITQENMDRLTDTIIHDGVYTGDDLQTKVITARLGDLLDHPSAVEGIINLDKVMATFNNPDNAPGCHLIISVVDPSYFEIMKSKSR